MTIGYQDNPNKEQLIQRAKEILYHGQPPQSESQDTYGAYNNSGDTPGIDNSYLYRKRGTPDVVILLVVIGLGLLGWLAWRYNKKKKHSRQS